MSFCNWAQTPTTDTWKPEPRTESRLAARLIKWADPVSIEILRVHVNARKRHVDIWMIVVLPAEAQFRVAPVAEMLPEEVGERSLRSLATSVRAELETGYHMTVRYHTRFAGQIDLGTDKVEEAQGVEDVISD